MERTKWKQNMKIVIDIDKYYVYYVLIIRYDEVLKYIYIYIHAYCTIVIVCLSQSTKEPTTHWVVGRQTIDNLPCVRDVIK